MSPAAAARTTARQVTRPWFGFAVVALLALLTAGFFANAPAGSDDGRATLEIANEYFRFTPSTCTITDNTFVVAGTGLHEGRPFSVSSSHSMIELAIGVDNELATPAPEDAWLTSDGLVDWERADGGLSASAALVDRNAPDGDPATGRLTVSCSD